MMWRELLKTQSIFSLFPLDSVSKINVDQFIVEADQGVCLENEEDISHFLFISIDSPLLLFKQNGDSANCIGSVVNGRSANLYSFLRILPSPYSIRAKESGPVLKIPRRVFDALFEKHPEVKAYLLRTTEDSAYRGLSKDLREIGISNKFIISLLTQMQTIGLTNHEELIKGDVTLLSAYYLSDGEFLLRPKSARKTPWIVPNKTWIAWEECEAGREAQYSIAAMRPSKALRISKASIDQLKDQFPQEFEKVKDWILQVVKTEDVNLESDEQNELEDAGQIFKNAIERNPFRLIYPFVSQNDEMDCAAACLSMISQFFGKDLSVQFWRSKLSTNREGTTLFDLATTSERFGFSTHCLDVPSLNEVESYMLPFVALRNFHYLVVYRIDRNYVVVGDPARGIRKMTHQEFHDGFENAGLFLKPRPEFSNQAESPSRWKHYLQLFESVKSDLAMAFVCGLIGVVISLAPPIITQMILDDVLINRNHGLLKILMIVSVGLLVVSSFVTWAQGYYFNHVMTKYNFRATTAFIQKMFSLPYQFFATRHVGDFTQRIGELSNLRAFITGTLFDVSMNLLTMSIYAVALFLLSPTVALFVLITGPILFIFPLLFSRYMSSIYAQLFEKRSNQSSRLTDYIRGIVAIKATGSEYVSRHRFDQELAESVQAESSFHMASLNVRTLTSGYFQIVSLGVLGTGAYLAVTGDLSPGRVISITIITSRIFGPLLALTREWDQFVETKAAISRLNDIFLSPSEKPATTFSTMTTSRSQLRGEIEFKEVWFRYGGEGSEWVIKDLNFKVEAGSKVAIVGPSGSGKSTIAFLLSRMYEPTRGTIFVDGRDYRDYDIDFLRQQIGLMPQETSLFAGTIAQNIALHKLETDPILATQAARRASSLNLILNKSNGFDYKIPHGGYGFSVGEKQRIALTRLFYNDPQVVILDEATSSLDGISEREILDGINNEMRGRTFLNIAHRYSTVSFSDFALVLNQGRVAGFGTLDFLKENNLIFRQLFDIEIERLASTGKKAS
jgi:ATP-binding cassette, subfamily B, bacterial HlyB/CyaB